MSILFLPSIIILNVDGYSELQLDKSKEFNTEEMKLKVKIF